MEIALVALRYELLRQLDQGKLALLFLLNLTAAFDMVNYNLLAHHLAATGIWGMALQWLVSFFYGLGQTVVLGSTCFNAL